MKKQQIQGFPDISLQKSLAQQIVGTNDLKKEYFEPSIKHSFTSDCSNTLIVNKLEVRRGISLENAQVLLVEDNLANQKILELALRKKVKRIDIAQNGLEAIEKFKRSSYDIILMDLQLPIMGGIEASRQIRDLERNCDHVAPIIAFSANNLSNRRESILKAGINVFLSKPFLNKTLIDLMKEYL